MAYFKQSYNEAQGNVISVETYRERRDELKEKHNAVILRIQARCEKKKSVLKEKIGKLNETMFAEIAQEMAKYQQERAELLKMIQ